MNKIEGPDFGQEEQEDLDEGIEGVLGSDAKLGDTPTTFIHLDKEACLKRFPAESIEKSFNRLVGKDIKAVLMERHDQLIKDEPKKVIEGTLKWYEYTPGDKKIIVLLSLDTGDLENTFGKGNIKTSLDSQNVRVFFKGDKKAERQK